MKHWHFSLGTFLVTSMLLAAQEPGFRLSEPWQAAYTGNDATGKHVIAFWPFKAGAETNDASGKGHHLKLFGAQISAQGRFGSCLESFPGWPVEDKRHAAVATTHPALSPKGAFTVELWVNTKPELKPELQPFLLDKKYVAHTDYQMILSRADGGTARRLIVNLGFDDDSATFTSEAAQYEPGVWHHVAFTYDGAGEVRFYRDGAVLGKASHPGRGAIVPGKHPLSIGDRIGSYYNGFPGFIAQARLCNGVLEFRPAAFTFTPERTSFVRMEKVAPLEFSVRNLQKATLAGAQVHISVAGLNEQKFAVPPLPSGASHALRYAVDTTLRPGSYALKARLEIPGERAYRSEEEFSFVIVPRPLPHRMPVIMWGIGQGAVLKEIPRLKEIGFTHCLGLGADFGAVWEAGKPTLATKPETVAEARQMLNEALANNIGVVAQLSPGHWLTERKDLQRVDRKGQPYKRGDVNAALPGLAEFCQNVGASVAQTYGAFPAFQAALIDTEVRDGSQVSFSAFDREHYRKVSGQDIPVEVAGKNGVDWHKLKDFPVDRVIPDDHPLLQFYRWFWTVGDGWNGLHSAVHRGLKSTGRADLWTWFDPAVRTASISGSGGSVDVVSQWTYSYPDPIRIGMPTDELFAMAGLAAAPQRVMKMTQLIWYRSQTAPITKGTNAPGNPWDDHDPDAAYITIAPMHLREAFWTKIARPVRGIMYHGWQSLVPTGSAGGYRFTHPDTQHELRRLIKQVVEPLGPTLLQVPDRRSNVAFLESFASQMFAQRGSYGWSHGWGGDAYQILHYAHLQPEVVYDETVLKRGLDGYRVLVLADCDVLTAGVAKRIKEFQKRGGIVVGDERLAPVIKPDVVMPVYTRTKKSDADKAELLARAAALRKALDSRYTRHADTDNPNVIPRCRQAGTADYVFLVNDHREFGDYVGQHGLVMENGLPSKAVLTVRRKNGHVYDLLARREVTTTASGGQLRVPVELGPCEGRVFMVTDQPIVKAAVNGPAVGKLGESLPCTVMVADSRGKPIAAVVPVRIDIVDPSGRQAEFSGYYGTTSGRLNIKVDLAKNDSPGLWQIRATELASGQAASHYVRVNR